MPSHSLNRFLLLLKTLVISIPNYVPSCHYTSGIRARDTIACHDIRQPNSMPLPCEISVYYSVDIDQ